MGSCNSKATASPSPPSTTYGSWSRQEEASLTVSSIQRTPPPTEPILQPNHPRFTPGANARNRHEIKNIYEMSDALGAGTFGTVFMARHKQAQPDVPWSTVAIKRARPNSTDTQNGERPIWSLTQLEDQSHEIRSLLLLRNGSPSVVLLYEYFLKGQEYFLVTELLGMELEQWKRTLDVFTEAMARSICRTLLEGLVYMHSKGVVHRDIKMQNILFKRNGDCTSLKFVDFGLSKILVPGETTRDFCGSNGYIPPEIYSGKNYRFEVDMFAFGVLLFRLLSDQKPFPVGNSEILRRKTLELRYDVQGEDWALVSEPAKNLIRKLLINREERLTAAQALAHPWMDDASESVLRSDGPLSRAYHVGAGRSRSGNAVLRQPAQPGSMSRGISKRYWVDASMRDAIDMVIFSETFHATVVEEKLGMNGEEGMVCYQENTPYGAATLPHYIGSLRRYTERTCRDLFRSIVQRVQILHDSSVAHRNLHPDNVLVKSNDNVSLKGFHFSQLIRPDRPLTGHFGYLYSWYAFKAPEVDQKFSHDRSVDVWSLGGILYMMLTGLPPFRGTDMELVDVKHAGIFDFDPVIPSGAAQRLVRNLLNIMPDERYTLEDILADPWIEADGRYLDEFDLSFAREQNSYW